MKPVLMMSLLALAACADLETVDLSRQTTTQVPMATRTWFVTQDSSSPGMATAIRGNNNLNPFYRSVTPRTVEAVRAIEQATRCRVERSSLWQDTSARYYSRLLCP